MDALVIEDGLVVDVIVVDGLDFDPGPGRTLMVAEIGGIGWRMEEGVLVPPEEQQPAPDRPLTVSRFQALAALLQAELLDAVTAWSNAPGTDPLHKLAFETATEFSRSSPTLAAGAAALGWADQQLDALFEAARQIKA